MTDDIQPDSAETLRLLHQVAAGDLSARGRLLERHLASIRKSVARRISPRLQSRIDLSDIVQETQVDLVKRLDDFLRRSPMPFRLWVIKTAHERLLKLERFHLRTAKRAMDRELPLPDQSSANLANSFNGKSRKPDSIASNRETASRVRRAIAQLPEKAREVIVLRYFEGLSNKEAARVLEISPEAAKKRYSRAILRLSQVFSEIGLRESDA